MMGRCKLSLDVNKKGFCRGIHPVCVFLDPKSSQDWEYCRLGHEDGSP